MYPPPEKAAAKATIKTQIMIEYDPNGQNLGYKVIGDANPVIILGMIEMIKAMFSAEHTAKAGVQKSNIMQLPPGTRLG